MQIYDFEENTPKDSLANITTSIQDLDNDLKQSINLIEKMVTSVSSIVEENVGGTEETKNSIEDLITNIQILDSQAHETTNKTQELIKLMNHFKLT